MRKMGLRPELAQLEQATAFFENILTEHNAPRRVVEQMKVVTDEIFSNIVFYSGATAVTLGCEAGEGYARLRFSDNGRPYDPTQKPDPDVTLPPEEREAGGMGIYIVRKLTDGLSYYYADGLNVLTLEKRW